MYQTTLYLIPGHMLQVHYLSFLKQFAQIYVPKEQIMPCGLLHLPFPRNKDHRWEPFHLPDSLMYVCDIHNAVKLKLKLV